MLTGDLQNGPRNHCSSDMGICADHFDDVHVKTFINSNLTEKYCDYCDDHKLAADFDAFHDFVSSAVYSEYCEPYEAGAAYDSDGIYYENRFPGVHVSWTPELLDELLQPDDHNIAKDLASQFDDDYLAPSEEIFGPSRNEYFLRGWQQFKQVVKHKIRFMFFSPGMDAQFNEDDSEVLNPAFVLDELRQIIDDLNLIVDVPAYSLVVYRARQHKLTESVFSAATLPSPPPKHAKANRMSPPGISMFYGAFDKQTCYLEISDQTKHNTAITVGDRPGRV